jgi:hypothetical protein
MQEDFLRALEARRNEIHSRWEALLRIERVNTPLANPAALVFMLDWSLDQVFAQLGRMRARRRTVRHSATAVHRFHCPCGRNPYLAYFEAGNQALVEALVLAQAARPGLDSDERDLALADLKVCMHDISQREIESFCSVCQFRAGADASAASAAPEDSTAAAAQVPSDATANRR